MRNEEKKFNQKLVISLIVDYSPKGLILIYYRERLKNEMGFKNQIIHINLISIGEKGILNNSPQNVL